MVAHFYRTCPFSDLLELDVIAQNQRADPRLVEPGQYDAQQLNDYDYYWDDAEHVQRRYGHDDDELLH